MFYITIDNDYHYEISLSLIKQLKINKNDLVFISYKSKRNTKLGCSNFKFIEMDPHPFCAGGGYKNIISYVQSIKYTLINSKNFFTCTDTLIITTEYQINNAILAKKMRSKGGKIFLVDEGIGFYFNNNKIHSSFTSFKDRVFLAIFNLIYILFRIPLIAKKAHEGKMFLTIKDKYINAIYSSLDLEINRDIKIFRFEIAKKKINQHSQLTSIFFATNFDCFKLKEEEMELSLSAINQLVASFDKVYIKIHPSDFFKKNEIFEYYKSMNSKKIKIVNNSLSATDAIAKFKPKTVVGTMSTALFDAKSLGCNVIFLYHFLPKINEFLVYDIILEKLNYKFIKSLSDIKP